MAALADMLKFLKTTGERPTAFGSFHIITLILIVVVTFLICKVFKDPSEKIVRRVLLIFSLIALLLEIYKQVIYSVEFTEKGIEWQYKWHIFPWQFCSTPIPAGLAAALIKNQKLHRAFLAYLASFSLVAGLVISLFPYSVYSTLVGINIQTAYCHGSMVVIGVFLLRSGYVKGDGESFRKAFGIFLAGAVVALILNEAAYLIGIPEGEVFDMYFISPYFPDDVPILAPIRRLISDPFFQFFYLALFTAAAYISMKCFAFRNKK